jgi:hypothetical protein
MAGGHRRPLPESASENLGNVRGQSDFGIRYPVAIDNDWTIWRAFSNQYRSRQYADAQGRIRTIIGEGGCGVTEAHPRAPGRSRRAPSIDGPHRRAGTGMAADSPRWRPAKPMSALRAESFASPGGSSARPQACCTCQAGERMGRVAAK